ncbi:hypothetical protein [Antarcticimicrobium sediminis]|uniref:hypothetical protein n=1 Tax=Antarcticimicrobium sediminis TaxID=2546227 RepID=UPI0014044F4F|nr:hypothetical protein [Antarcticimicrobium sediminis]
MRGERLGLERRRFWRDGDKLEIVTPVGPWSPDAGALVVPMVISVESEGPVLQPSGTETLPQTAIELRLRRGRRWHFDSTMDLAALTSLCRVVEAAWLVRA